LIHIGVVIITVDGTSDDIDVVTKACFLDNEFREKYRLTSINSINWPRILIQIVHYFYAYFQVPIQTCIRVIVEMHVE